MTNQEGKEIDKSYTQHVEYIRKEKKSRKEEGQRKQEGKKIIDPMRKIAKPR